MIKVVQDAEGKYVVGYVDKPIDDLDSHTQGFYDAFGDALLAPNYSRDSDAHKLVFDELSFEPNIPTVKTRLLIEVTKAFTEISYYSQDKTVVLSRFGTKEGQIPDLSLSSIRFKDVLNNFVQGKGSIFELLQFSLASDLLEFLILFRDKAIGFESLLAEIAQRYDLSTLDISNKEYDNRVRALNSFEYSLIDFDDDLDRDIVPRTLDEKEFKSIGLTWDGNVMVKKVWRFWESEGFNVPVVLSGLSETEWREGFFTNEFLGRLPAERIQ